MIEAGDAKTEESFQIIKVGGMMINRTILNDGRSSGKGQYWNDVHCLLDEMTQETHRDSDETSQVYL